MRGSIEVLAFRRLFVYCCSHKKHFEVTRLEVLGIYLFYTVLRRTIAVVVVTPSMNLVGMTWEIYPFAAYVTL